MIKHAFYKRTTLTRKKLKDIGTHSKLHAACSLIINAIPDMFSYLDDAEIPCTTNRLENYFTHLKTHLHIVV